MFHLDLRATMKAHNKWGLAHKQLIIPLDNGRLLEQLVWLMSEQHCIETAGKTILTKTGHTTKLFHPMSCFHPPASTNHYQQKLNISS